MAQVVVTAIEIQPGELFDETGEVRNWMRGITVSVKDAVISKCPPNRSRARWHGRPQKGALVASISASLVRSGWVENIGLIRVRAPHAVYVLDGTAAKGTRYIYRETSKMQAAAVLANRQRNRGFIKPEEGRGMWMRLPPYLGYPSHHLRVHGQRPNNFLFDGYNEIARVHEALRPFHNPDAF